MANVYKNAQATITSSGSDDPIYTTPDETSAVVKSIRLYNTDSSARTVQTTITDTSGSADYIFDNSSVLATDSVDVLNFNNVVVLEAGDILKMQCATADVIKVTVAVLEMTRT